MIQPTMSSPISNQIQIYRRLVQHRDGHIVEYSQVETRTFPNQEYISPAYHPPGSSGLEFFLLTILIFLVPIFIFMSYRYGKKIGKMENKFAFANGDSALIRKRRLSSQLIQETPIEVLEGERALLPVENSQSSTLDKDSCDKESHIKLKESSQQREPLIEQENKKNQIPKAELESPTQNANRGPFLAIENKQNSNASEKSGITVISQSDSASDDLTRFEVVLKQSYDKEGVPTHLNYAPEEKVKLHTDDNQIMKKEVKLGFSVERKNGNLEKVETTEIRTVYHEDAQEPTNNALLLQKTYENYKTSSMNDKQLLALTNDKPSLERSKSSGPGTTVQLLPSTTTGTDLMSHVLLSDKIKTSEVVATKVVSQPSSFEKEIQAFIENDDLPHETGKFNKIFKNAEVIGEGSFGEVYKVVHKLDGKIYAVKKVKLRFGRFEDLQKKSKVFREVFAMTDLHHPNIVRYSTCWVELEKKEETHLSIKAQDKILELKSESSQVSEESKPELTRSVSDCIRTSSVGFEWDLGGDDSPVEKLSEKSQNKKKALTHIRDPSLFASVQNTLVKGDLDESSSASTISKAEYSEYFQGYKLYLYLYIQMEYCSGQNLRNYLDTTRIINSAKVLQMFRKILEGVNTIHKRGILHRDLKPANIFLDENENVKIGDFGLASLDHTAEESKEHHHHHHHNKKIDSLNTERSHSKTVGTPMYTSPEQESGGRYNQKTDVYSLGFILCEMLAGLSTHHERYQLFTLLRKSHELPPEFKAKYSKESELILKMTALSPEERPNAEEIITHIDELIKKLSTNPTED